MIGLYFFFKKIMNIYKELFVFCSKGRGSVTCQQSQVRDCLNFWPPEPRRFTIAGLGDGASKPCLLAKTDWGPWSCWFDFLIWKWLFAQRGKHWNLSLAGSLQVNAESTFTTGINVCCPLAAIYCCLLKNCELIAPGKSVSSLKDSDQCLV